MIKKNKKVEVCFSPILLDSYIQKGEEPLIVVIDIFRASTSICSAMDNGAKKIITVASLDEAERLKDKGYLVVAERNAKRCSFADFGNSPLELATKEMLDKEVVFTTTNCTYAIEKAKEFSSNIVIGAFSNIKSLVDYSLKSDKDIILLCAGWKKRYCIEDTIFAGAFVELFCTTPAKKSLNDSTKISLELWNTHKDNLQEYLSNTEHYQRLISNNLLKDIEFCLNQDTTEIIPIYNIEQNAFLVKK